MEITVSKYFCIFCDNTFQDIREAYEHYKMHMSIGYYCKTCDYDIKNHENSACKADHSMESREDICGEESIIEMWIERLLSYQEELREKSWKSLVGESKFYRGCPACDTICNLFRTESSKFPDMTQFSINLMQGSHKTHLSRHANAHLRYYPYECLQCEKIGRYNKKTDLSEMTRHMKRAHGKLLKNYETANMVKKVKITKLERFYDAYFRYGHSNNNTDSSGTEKSLLPVMKKPRFDGPSTSASATLIFLKDQALKNIDITKNDKSLVPLIVSDFSNSNANVSNGIAINNEQKVHSVIPQNSLRSIKTIIGDDHFRHQFGNVLDESNDSTAMNSVEDPDTEYFCIFCEEKLKTKEDAHRHYQFHLNYYPIICLLCGEALTDMESFMSHHTSVHPNAMKGRYKKKEQSIVEKWISAFLYSQATIIRAFPPREQCPVCDKIFTQQEINNQRPRRCTINRKIDHVHRHLCYMPYECLRCRESGNEFMVAYFESKAHSHIKQKHPEIDDDESRWNIFQKTISIPKLDEFVRNYLLNFGISMDSERRPTKKQLRPLELPQFDMLNPSFNTNVSDSNIFNMVFTGVVGNSSGANVIELTNENTDNNNGVELVLMDDNESAENDISDKQLIVNVAPQMLTSENGVTLKENFFCVFCSSVRFTSKTDAYPHYGEHFDYMPVICKTCDNKFSDIDSLMHHHQTNHPKNVNINYEICEDQVLMKWTDDFLESQLRSSNKNIMECACRNVCPVCAIIKGNNSFSSPCYKHNDVSFSDHIHQHLLYFPYECSICRQNGKTIRVPNLDILAMNHVKECHNIENASMYQLCKNFPKTLFIPKLEKFIGECVNRKRILDRRGKMKPESSSEPQQYVNSGVSEDVTVNSKTSPGKIEHIRVENGRVINLPPSVNKTVVTLSTFQVRCLHCNEGFPNRKLLKVHHFETHKGLSIACYTPLKASLLNTNP